MFFYLTDIPIVKKHHTVNIVLTFVLFFIQIVFYTRSSSHFKYLKVLNLSSNAADAYTSIATPCFVEITSLVPVRYIRTEQRCGSVAVMLTYSQ